MAAFQGTKTLENVRDDIRKILHAKDRQTYPYGHAGTSLSQLTLDIFSSDVKISKSQDTCTICNFSKPAVDDNLGCVFVMDNTSLKSTSHTLNNSAKPSAEKCPECQSEIRSTVHYVYFPGMLLFDHSAYNIKPDIVYEVFCTLETFTLHLVLFHLKVMCGIMMEWIQVMKLNLRGTEN